MAATGLEKIPQNLPGQEGETLDKSAESYKIIIKEKDDYEDIGRKERESNSKESGSPEEEGRALVAHSARIANREGTLHPQADLTDVIQEAQAVDDYLKNNPDRRFDKALRDELKGKSHLEILNILAEKHEQLKKDSLTGLRSKLAHQNREVLPFQAVIDLNKFKPVNDTHGHDAGDKLLTQFGKAVKTAAGDESYRVGGDEFALQGNTREELEAKIQKLRDILSKEPFEVNGEKYTLEFSAGIGEDYKTADSEMYKEKKGGKLDAKESPADIARKNSPGINIDSKPNYRFPPIKKAKSDVYKVSPEVKEVPVDQITLSRDVPQFKSNASDKGIVEPLSGAYDRLPTNPIVLWQRENGALEIITGRHRYDLAQRTGEKTIPAQIVKEADGFTTKDALTFDAEQNIKDNQGSDFDYANYFRNTNITEEEAKSRGVLRGEKANTAFLLGKSATDSTFNAYRSGQIKFKQAAAIAKAAPGDEALQNEGLRYLLNEGSKANELETENYIKMKGHFTPKQT